MVLLPGLVEVVSTAGDEKKGVSVQLGVGRKMKRSEVLRGEHKNRGLPAEECSCRGSAPPPPPPSHSLNSEVYSVKATGRSNRSFRMRSRSEGGPRQAVASTQASV